MSEHPYRAPLQSEAKAILEKVDRLVQDLDDLMIETRMKSQIIRGDIAYMLDELKFLGDSK